MKKIWFTSTSDTIMGPLSTQEVMNGIQSGQFHSVTWIWWMGQTEWISLEDWENKKEELLKTSVIEKPEWYYRVSKKHGPYTENELAHRLIQAGDLADVQIWSNGMDKWKSVYQVENIINQLGLTKRKYPRVGFQGKAIITKNNKEFNRDIINLSAEGLGIADVDFLKPNDQINIKIKSDLLPSDVELFGLVYYVTHQGYSGISFINIDNSNKKIILDFIQDSLIKQKIAA